MTGRQREQVVGDFDAECLGGPQIDGQLIFGRLHDRQISRAALAVTASDCLLVASACENSALILWRMLPEVHLAPEYSRRLAAVLVRSPPRAKFDK